LATRWAYRYAGCRLDDLVAALRAGGHRVVGPVLREGAVSYGEIASASVLPHGWTDRQGHATRTFSTGSSGHASPRQRPKVPPAPGHPALGRPAARREHEPREVAHD
jgi:hypothetical protein